MLSEPTLAPRGTSLIRWLLGGFVGLMALAILGNIAFVAVQGAREQADLSRSVANARDLYIAMQHMALDGTSLGEPERNWPGDLPDHTVREYLGRLIRFGYLTEKQVLDLTGSAKYPSAKTLATSGPDNFGFTIWRAAAADSGTCFLLTTRATPPPRTRSRRNAPPADERLMIFRKNGSGEQHRTSALTLMPGDQPAKYPLTLAP